MDAAGSDERTPDGFVRMALGGGFSDHFGPLFVRREDGIVAFRVQPRHANAFGVCHGGAMATFADAQMIAVVDVSGRPEDHTPTVSLSVDYLAPAPLGAWVEAKVVLARATRTLIFTQALIIADGAPVARSNAIYRNNANSGV